jgi:hypothetical protein
MLLVRTAALSKNAIEWLVGVSTSPGSVEFFLKLFQALILC